MNVLRTFDEIVASVKMPTNPEIKFGEVLESLSAANQIRVLHLVSAAAPAKVCLDIMSSQAFTNFIANPDVRALLANGHTGSDFVKCTTPRTK